jgi:5-methyltetrahydrofolate--homocysteine methyltransferase
MIPAHGLSPQVKLHLVAPALHTTISAVVHPPNGILSVCRVIHAMDFSTIRRSEDETISACRDNKPSGLICFYGVLFEPDPKDEELHMDLQPLFVAVLEGDAASTQALVSQALAAGVDPQTVLDGYLIPAMDEVGRRFEENEYFVPELLIAARAMKGALALIRPLLADKGAKPVGRVVIGTVRGDLHDIGKNLVAAMLEGGGFQVIDVGVDASPEKFVDAVREHRPEILAMSALLTTTMPGMKTTIEALEQSGLRETVKVMIGGAPITQRYADEIRADGFSDNASGAVRTARTLIAV